MWFWLGGTTTGVITDTSAELVARLRRVTKRPLTDRDLTAADAYMYLTDAQTQLAYNLAAHIPDVLKGVPEKMSTPDKGLTYLTAGEALGHIEIYPAPYRDPLVEGPLWSGTTDYTREGPRKIRMCGNRARTFTDGPYARYVRKPGVIDETNQPTLEPHDARRILPYLAAALWAEAGGVHDPSPYLRTAERLLWGSPDSAGDVGLIPSYKVAHFSSGLLSGPGPHLWTRGPDLGRVG